MSSPQPNKFYVTTPIYYVNARPHIGHAYTTIVADVLARRHRLLGDDTFFLTGTDEHGQKIERSAAKAGMAPQQFADNVSGEFARLWERMGITHDKFIRTTSAGHGRGVQQLFRTLYAEGKIYLDKYTGAYCVSDEAFVDAPVGSACPDCGRTLEEVTEENFFFRLSEYQLPLLDLIESGKLKIENEARRNEVLSFLRGPVAEKLREKQEAFAPNAGAVPAFVDGMLTRETFAELPKTAAGTPYVPGALKDLSVSRSSFTWGIPVPADVQSAAGATQPHVVYVWLDALANYMTAVGYGAEDPTAAADFAKWWPADLHLVGKEIIRFHCVYWPAFLLAAKLELPKAITAHGWLLFDNSKMSKSKGNIVRTETILEAFGALCPPPPASSSASSSTTATNSVILSERSESKDLHDPQPSTPAEPSQPTQSDRDLFASDILRYFLLREIPFGQDGSFSFEALVTRYNADLANGYGNLVSRVLKMIEQYCEGKVPGGAGMAKELFPIAENLLGEAIFTDMPSDMTASVTKLAGYISTLDRHLSEIAPWKLAKSEDVNARPGLEAVLFQTAESIRIITVLLHPILPFTTTRVWQQLGLDPAQLTTYNLELSTLQWGGLKPGTKLGALAPIFPRADKGLAQIMADIEEQNAGTAKTDAEARPAASLKSAATPTAAAPVATNPTDPAAPPRALDEPEGTLPVAGSASMSTHQGPTPSHADATPSGPFASVASQTPITAGPADASPQITIDDFVKVELRVAEVKLAERIPKADKLLRLEVDLGAAGQRQILSGIAEWYAPEDLVGRRIIVITNLAPRKMRGLESHGMLLAASEEGGKPFLATVPEGVPVGTRLK